MVSQRRLIEPVRVAFMQILLELPTRGWQSYDFRAMSDAEGKAATMLVRTGMAILQLRCRVRLAGGQHSLYTTAIIRGNSFPLLRGEETPLKKQLLLVSHGLPGWDAPSSVLIPEAKRSALCLTAEGERRRDAYLAGDPDALRDVCIVPGLVRLRDIKIVPPAKPSVTEQPDTQATAGPSVTYVNKVATVYLSQIALPPPADEPSPTGEADAKTPSSFFTVSHWSELAIGIDEHRRYWAKTPAPAEGERFKKTDSHELSLPGKQWPILLELLADSPSGDYCSAETLMREWRLWPPTSSMGHDSRARRDDLEDGVTSELTRRQSGAAGQLGKTLRDLARRLRKQVDGPKGKGPNAALSLDGDKVRSGFTVGHIVPDESRHHYFRRAPQSI